MISRVARPSPTDEAPGIATLRAAASDRLDGRYDVELLSVTRRFGAVTAVDDLTLHIEAGSFFSLLGPSGCGKTTTLRLIAGFEQPDHGEIRIAGLAVAGVPAHRRNVNTVFQNYALFPHLNVRENVGFGLRMQRLPKSQVAPRVEKALDRVQLLSLGNRRPGQLSGGQQQRVAIARALVLEPQLMLMDEPLSNLDAKLRREMRTEIRRLHNDLGLTTIYVTHDQEEALSLSDRIVVLRDGTTQQVGTPDQVFMHPANAFVAGFMGYRNSFSMTLSRASGLPILSGEGLQLESTGVDEVMDGPVEVRIRPDDVDPQLHVNQLQVLCDVVEYQGKHFEVLGRLPSGQEVLLRTSGPVKPGDTITCGVSPDRVLVFPKDTEGVNDAPDGSNHPDIMVPTP